MNRFYVKLGIVFVTVALAAFTPRYFAPLVGGDESIRLALHLHGATGFAWLVLYAVQSQLVHARSTRLHMQLGVSSVLVAPILFASGVLVSLENFVDLRAAASPGANPSLLINLSDMAMFATLFVLGWTQRTSTESHRHWMTLTSVVLMNAAFFRVIAFATGVPVIGIFSAPLVTIAMLALLVIRDRKLHDAPHRGLLRASIAIGVIHVLRIPIGLSPLWRPIADLTHRQLT
ncbi:MAG: hypothetical protein AAFQ82_08400 [Myxococcota bacterium]